MGEVVQFDGGIPEKPNVAVGQALFAAIMDQLEAMGVGMIPRRLISIASSQGRDALDDGVDPEMVLVGCVMAIQKGTPQYTTHIIGDCVLTKAGAKLSNTQYNDALNSVSRAQQPAVQRFRAVAEAIEKRKQLGRAEQ